MDPWAGFEEVKPPPKGAPAADPWADFERPSFLSRAGTYVDNLARQAVQGATFGFGDEATAAMSAAATMPIRATTGKGPTPGEVYDAELKANRDRDKGFAKENPVASTIANVAGGISTLPLLPAWALGGGALTIPGAMARGGAAGFGIGGATGFGSGEDGLDNRLTSAAWGAGTGATIGALAPLLLAGAGWVGRAAAESRPGQWVGQNIVAPAASGAARVIDAMAPKAAPRSLSAAAPDSGPLPADGMLSRASSALTDVAEAATNAPMTGAQRRILDSFIASGRDPARLTREADRLGPDAMPLNIGGAPTLRVARAAKTASARNEEMLSEAFNTQAARMSGRMVDDIDAAAGGSTPFRQAFEKARTAKADEAKRLYDDAEEAAKAWSGGIGAPTEELKAVMAVPMVRDLMAKIRDKAAQAGEDLTPLQVAQRVKQELSKAARAAADEPGSSKTTITGLAERFQKALRDANQKFALADDAYAAASGIEDAMELGRRFMARGVNDLADSVRPEAIAKLTKDQRDGFAIGLADTMRTMVTSGGRGARSIANEINDPTNEVLRRKLTEALGEKEARRIFDMAYREATFAAGRNYAMSGSTSIDKASDAAAGFNLPQGSDLNMSGASLLGLALRGAQNWAARSRAGNEQVRTETTKMITDPGATAHLIDAFEREMLRRRASVPVITRGASAVGAGEAAR